MKYRVLKDETTYDLSVKVNEALKKGWTPQGGITSHFDSKMGMFGRTYFSQALIKKEKKTHEQD